MLWKFLRHRQLFIKKMTESQYNTKIQQSEEAPTSVGRPPVLGMTPEQLREVCQKVGAKPFAAKQMARWLYVARVTDFDQMTDLSKEVRARLAKMFTVGREEPIGEARSTDGTIKYLFRGTEGRHIEAVYIPDRDRATLCVSSQAGCRMGCKFCMTGRLGYQGNITVSRIINQVLSIDDSESLTNIVFMGMGEPCDNIDAVMQAIEILTAPWGLAWSPKRITVSTIGKLPELKRLLNETKVHIAISVHNPFATDRAVLMPSEKAWPLQKLFRELSLYDWSRQRRLSIEYIMWRGINDDLRHADALARIAKPVNARVNLIRFHDIGDTDLKPCTTAVMERFRDRLNELGVTATIRASRGEDIMAACGMLAGNTDKQPEHLNRLKNES